MSLDDITGANGLLIGKTIRVRRQKLELTLQDVAEVAGISIGYLSLIERDKAVPTLTTLAAISKALGVGMEFLITRPQPTDCVSRARNRPQFVVGSSQLRYERLGATFPGSELSSFIMTLEPGYQSDIVTHAGEETIFVLTGVLDITLEDEILTLAECDSAHYDASRPHGWANRTKAPVRALWTGTIDLFEDRTAT
ncbi:XRE family transcriptional regulator [Marivita sp.]|uniref:helix-turn-helix domain-containing protein n=1 Tax=Marivita sp. TaxID=2003365 RepID=UPI0025C6C973|nr:XRE family transcriptional regulator [Marivita sp.]